MEANPHPPQAPIRVEKLHPTIGLEVIGVDTSKLLTDETTCFLKELSFEGKVLLFRDQSLTEHDLGEFAAHFGPTSQVPPTGAQERISNVSRLGVKSTLVEPSMSARDYATTARIWHTDSSWRPVPTWLSFLYCIERPEVGGDTCFADMVTAYETLPSDRKSALAKKHMVHDWNVMRKIGPSVPNLGDDAPPPVTHPLVRTVEGRKSLFLSAQVCFWVGNLALADGEALFNDLIEHATSPPFVYRHQWCVGDLLVWDNRTTMHRVLPYDLEEPRMMFRTEVCGEAAPQ